MNRYLIFAFLTFTTLAHADKIPAIWRAQYRAEKQIIQARNFDGYKALLSPDYKSVQPDGKIKTYKEVISELAPFFKAKKITMKEKLTHVAKRGDIVDVSFDARVTFVYGPKKVVHFHEVGTDSWKKSNGKWLMIKTVDTVAE